VEGLASEPGPFGFAAPETSAADFFPAEGDRHPHKTKTALLGRSHPSPGLFQRLRSHIELLVLITNRHIPYRPGKREHVFSHAGGRWLCGALLPIMNSCALVNAAAANPG